MRVVRVVGRGAEDEPPGLGEEEPPRDDGERGERSGAMALSQRRGDSHGNIAAKPMAKMPNGKTCE